MADKDNLGRFLLCDFENDYLALRYSERPFFELFAMQFHKNIKM